MQINAIIVYITTENDGKTHKNGGYVCAFKAHRVGRIDNEGKGIEARNGLN